MTEHRGIRTKEIKIDDSVGRILVLSDLHSFAEPLAALDEIAGSSPDEPCIVIAGDLFCAGPHPAETVEWVRRRAEDRVALGNHDEGTLRGAEEPALQPPYTEPGAYQRLSADQIEYLRSLPHILHLEWKGFRIRVMHGHFCFSERDVCGVSWMARPSELLERFPDPAFDLTAVAHTHYPFVAERQGTLVANCGAVSGLLLGLLHEDGSITPWGDEETFTPPKEIYSTFLSVTSADDGLEVQIEKFDYDRRGAIESLRAIGDPGIENRERWLLTGVTRG